MSRHIRIGTRASPLALAQSQQAADALVSAFNLSRSAVECVPFTTKGDAITDRPLADIGGKGLFTQELTRALHAKKIDCAVHSLKDLPTEDNDGLTIAAVLPRADARDALVLNPARFDAGAVQRIEDLPKGARVGTASLRRKAQALRARPDLKIEALRGNIATRLQRMETAGLDACILAVAAFERLGKVQDADNTVRTSRYIPLGTDAFIPAAGQGAIAVQCLATNYEMQLMLAELGCVETGICTMAERAFLARLGGSCRTPIAAYATLAQDGALRLRGMVASPDGASYGTVDMDESDCGDAALGPPRAANLGERAADQLATTHPELLPE